MLIVLIIVGIVASLYLLLSMSYHMGAEEWHRKYDELKETMEPQGVWLDKYKREMEFHDSLRKQHEKLKERNFKSLLEKNQLNDYIVAIRYYASLLLMVFKGHPTNECFEQTTNLLPYKQLMKAITDIPDCYIARPEKYPSLAKDPPCMCGLKGGCLCGGSMADRPPSRMFHPGGPEIDIIFDDTNPNRASPSIHLIDCACQEPDNKYKMSLKQIRFMAANATIHTLLKVIEEETECVSSFKTKSRTCGTPSSSKKPK